MGRVKVTTDMLIGIGLCIALIIALIKGSSTEICIGIASNLGGYMGRSLMTEQFMHSAISTNTPPPPPAKTSNVERKPKTSNQEKGATSNEAGKN